MKKSDLDKHLARSRADEGGGNCRSIQPGRRGGRRPAREQRRLDAAAGLVPFACKLPSDLAATLRERSAGRADGINGLVAELLQKALR